jgi:hypothetical protein
MIIDYPFNEFLNDETFLELFVSKTFVGKLIAKGYLTFRGILGSKYWDF